MVELRNERLKADPSQGSHFFQNITSLGIPYMTISEGAEGFVRWQMLDELSGAGETAFLRHVRTASPLTVKIDGRSAEAIVRV
jgi:hypothetical protein